MKVENLFDYLRRKDGSKFDQGTIENWYKARAYVLDKLKDVAIGPESKEHLHVVVGGDGPLMLSIVRQVALLAHYANYKEETGENRTKITLVSGNKDIINNLKEEKHLCNLLDHCKYSVGSLSYNKDSYIDIELDVVNSKPEVYDKKAIVVDLSDDDAKSFLNGKKNEELYTIDIRKAVLASRMYDLGTVIDNLPAEDIHCASRYAMALDVFQHDYLKRPIGNDIEKALSNIFCADCFESRAKGIGLIGSDQKTWENYNEALSKSEHARWVVEKLIMGFRPLSPEEHVEDEEMFGDTKKRNRKKLKNDFKAHIDICSYADLRRVNPEDLKKDSFLMLAIPAILKKLGIK